MKRPVDLARRFLAVADRDIKTLQLLIAAPESDDQAIGFHAQQAIEKCPKAVLSAYQIAFRKTHDLVELLDLLRDEERTLPPNAESNSKTNTPQPVRYGRETAAYLTGSEIEAIQIIERGSRGSHDRLLRGAGSALYTASRESIG